MILFTLLTGFLIINYWGHYYFTLFNNCCKFQKVIRGRNNEIIILIITPFESNYELLPHSRIPLRYWAKVYFLLVISQKGGLDYDYNLIS
jgi:hypothetical protein